MSGILWGKTVYAFGDSIVYGHTAPRESALRLTAEECGLELSTFAQNGATVLPGDNQILAQLDRAPARTPDFIVFDGYTNDAYGAKETDCFNSLGEHPDITACYGTIRAEKPDGTTFCGAFEMLLREIKRRWPESNTVFLTVHKSGARDFAIQARLHELTVKMCGQWGVTVADLFAVPELDTRDAGQMRDYIIDGWGSHPNLRCCREFYVPAIVGAMTGAGYGSKP